MPRYLTRSALLAIYKCIAVLKIKNGKCGEAFVVLVSDRNVFKTSIQVHSGSGCA